MTESATLVYQRLAYAKTDSRNRHGSWHLHRDATPDYFACGERKQVGRAYQRWEITVNDDTTLLRPPGVTCLKCLTASGMPSSAIEIEKNKRRRRG